MEEWQCGRSSSPWLRVVEAAQEIKRHEVIAPSCPEEGGGEKASNTLSLPGVCLSQKLLCCHHVCPPSLTGHPPGEQGQCRSRQDAYSSTWEGFFLQSKPWELWKYSPSLFASSSASLPGTFAVAVPQTSQEGCLMGSEQKDLASVEPLCSAGLQDSPLGCTSWCWAPRTLSPALGTLPCSSSASRRSSAPAVLTRAFSTAPALANHRWQQGSVAQGQKAWDALCCSELWHCRTTQETLLEVAERLTLPLLRAKGED